MSNKKQETTEYDIRSTKQKGGRSNYLNASTLMQQRGGSSGNTSEKKQAIVSKLD